MAIIAFKGFLYSGEFTYKAKDLYNKRSFKNTSLLYLDITFNNLDEHIIILLKQSKTNYNHISINIIIAIIATLTCLMQALRRLFKDDPQPLDSPLFQLSTGLLLY
jgi:hypothetical protein